MKVFKEHWFLSLIGVFGLLFVLFPYDIIDGIRIFGFKININKYNELGDFVGGITAPFLSIIAVWLLYSTYKSQKNELLATREIMLKQSETLDKQQFEMTFFNMLNLHHEIVKSIDLIKNKSIRRMLRFNNSTNLSTENSPQIEHGRDCFRTFYEGFKHEYSKTLASFDNEVKEMDFTKIIDSTFVRYFKRHQSDLGHYFRNLYHLFKLICTSQVKNKQDYASLVRAQLSSHELLMLFYNSLSEQGKEFKTMIEAFHILKNMPFDELITVDHKALFNCTAF